MLCSADYYLVTCSQRRLLCADVCSARTGRCYQNRKFTVPSQIEIIGAANWQRRLVRAEHTSAHTITTVTHRQCRIVGAANVGSTNQPVLHDVITHDKLFQHILVGATSTSAPSVLGASNVTKEYFRAFFMVRVGAHKRIVSATRNSQHLLLFFVANTILFCFTSGKINDYSYKMAAQ